MSSNHHQMDRRSLLKAGGALIGAGMTHSGIAAAASMTRTTDQVMGPFYPVVKPLDVDADLTTKQGRPGQAEGEIIHLMGRVLDIDGKPIENASVKIWQANAAGRYTHYADTNPAPLDPNFEGSALQRTDAEGRYRFKTIRPGAYAVGPITRTPHIHFEVVGPRDRVVTQMYFDAEPLNETDVLLRSSPNPATLVAAVSAPTPDLEPASQIVKWDVVLGWNGTI